MWIIRLIVGLMGLVILYLTFVMEETAEGVWVNRIEALWIDLDDRRRSVGETTVLVFNAVAIAISQLFDRSFGAKLLSLRSIGVSSSLSFTSFFFTLALVLEGLCYLIERNSGAVKPELLNQIPLLVILGAVLLILAVISAALALLPMLLRSRAWAWISCLPAILLLLATGELIRNGIGDTKQYGLLAALIVSVISDVLLLMLVRRSLLWISERTSLARLVCVLTVQVIALLMIFVIPYRLPIVWYPKLAGTSTGQTLFVLAIFNLPTAFASIAFICGICIVLTHQLVWPLLSKIIYILTRNEVLDKRKTLRSFGLLCVAYAAFKGSLWHFVGEKLLK